MKWWTAAIVALPVAGLGLRPAKRWLARRDWRSERGQRFPRLNGKGLGPNMWRVR